jgi:single-strand DNA-binding protein
MNHVNLIGRICSAPRVVELENGRRIAKFSMSTKEMVLTEDGSSRTRSQWHRMTAWGKWARVLEELGASGMELAVEGKLITRFYSNNGKRRCISEVEVNDLVIL